MHPLLDWFSGRGCGICPTLSPRLEMGVSVYFCLACRMAPTPMWTGITYAYAWQLLPGDSGFGLKAQFWSSCLPVKLLDARMRFSLKTPEHLGCSSFSCFCGRNKLRFGMFYREAGEHAGVSASYHPDPPAHRVWWELPRVTSTEASRVDLFVTAHRDSLIT